MALGEFEWRAGVAGRGEKRIDPKVEGNAQYAERKNGSSKFRVFRVFRGEKIEGDLRHRQPIRSPAVSHKLTQECCGYNLNASIDEEHLAGALV